MKETGACIFLFLFLICLASNGCGGSQSAVSLDISPKVTADSQSVWPGMPLELDYVWKVGKLAARPEKELKIFVHFLDERGELVVDDDHFPDPPLREWKNESEIRYSRTVFLPEFRAAGKIFIKTGFYKPEDPAWRPALNGTHAGDYAYLVQELTIVPNPVWNEVYFEDGWYSPEAKSTRQNDRWIWSGKVGRIVTGNPKRESVLYLEAHSPSVDLGEPQQVEIFLNDEPLKTFIISDERQDRILKKIRLPKEILGDESWIHFKIKLDKTYIPAAHGSSDDVRELGLKVFHFALRA